MLVLSVFGGEGKRCRLGRCLMPFLQRGFLICLVNVSCRVISIR